MARQTEQSLRELHPTRRPSRRERRQTPEAQSPFNYTEHTRQVRDGLSRFGFGEVVEHITPQGLGEQYISWAQKQLFGQEWDPSRGLPERIGEVPLSATLSAEMRNVFAAFPSMNAGYGHLRPAILIDHVVQVLGGKTKSIFLGGPEDVVPRSEIGPWKGFDYNRFFRAIARGWEEKSLRDAYQQGMIDYLPEERSEGPLYTGLARAVVLLRDPVDLLGQMSKGHPIKAMEQTIANGYAVKDTDTPEALAKQARSMKFFFGSMMRNLIQPESGANPDAHHLVLSTHPLLARLIGEIQDHPKNTQPFSGFHFGPDVDQPLVAWVAKQLNFVELMETARKWGNRLGLPHPEIAPNTEVMHGYIAPPAVFERQHLAAKRAEALKEGAPLTVVALASGVAPAQLGSFSSFLENAQQQMREGHMRVVVQCGAEEGGGLIVHDKLRKVVEQHGLQEQVVLHVAPTPQAAVDFFEAVAWAPVPMALFVKGAETARMAQALGIPVIPTGIVGDHELGNFIATLKDTPSMLTFIKGIGAKLADECQRLLPTNPLTDHYTQTDPGFLATLQASITQRTAPDMDGLVAMVKDTILTHPTPPSNPSAMLNMLESMIRHDTERKQAKKPTRRILP